MTERIVLTVSAAGVVSAATEGIQGERCLDYIVVLEDLLDARTVESSYTADYDRSRTSSAVVEYRPDVDTA